MSLIDEGHKVKVHYKGTLTDGTEFDNSHNREGPIEFEVGSGQMIEGFDAAVRGMGLGEVKVFTLNPDDAYGTVNSEAIQEYPKTVFPEDFEFDVGSTVQGKNSDGQPMLARILSHTDESVVLDHNHPLAGEALTFEVEIIEVN